MLQAIDRAADQIDRIMSELLDAQQIDLGLLTLILEPIDLGRLVEQVVGRVAADSPCHRVRSTAAPGVVVRADGRRLSEVMHILLDNAIRYSPDGGDVDVSVSLIEGDARVSVRDHGVGIPIERRDRLFQRFYRAHTGTPHDYGGTGLGLYVARTIVERHGGSIVFEPTEGGGSTFTFQFPTGTES